MHRRPIGQPLNLPTAPVCPPGYHWENPPSGPIQGMGACVPNRTVQFRALPVTPPSAPAPARIVPFRAPPSAPSGAPPVVTSSPAPAPTVIPAADRAFAPAPVEPCPEPWPWWWLLVAAAVGGGLGYWAAGDEKTKKNIGRIANAAGARIVDRASGPILARLVG